MDENRQASDDAKAHAIRSAAAQAADPRVDLAMLRTELALDRTQLAWVRTAFAFITAGLAIDQATAALHEARVLARVNWVMGSHVIATTLIIASTLFLLFATLSYCKQARTLARLKGAEPAWLPPALPMSALVIAFGGALSILMLVWS